MAFTVSLWWLILAPVALFPPVYVLRRFRLGGWMACLVSLFLAYYALIIPRGELLRIFGRPLFYDELAAYNLALLFGMTAYLFALSQQISQGWTFYPFGVLILGLCTIVMVNSHIGIISLFVVITTLLSVFVIQGGRLGSVRAASRVIIAMILAMCPLLLAAWRIDLYQLNVDNRFFLNQIAILLGLGFALWFGVVPFHGWISALAQEASAGVTVFVVLILSSTATVSFLHLLTQSPWLFEITVLFDALIIAGIVSVLVGGILASLQRSFGALFGYALVFDMGIGLMALGSLMTGGAIIIVLTIFTRMFALPLLATPMLMLQHSRGDDSFKHCEGLAQQSPLLVMGVFLGLLSLLALPFSIGFTGRWLLLQTLSQHSLLSTYALVGGSIGVALGYVRGIYALLKRPTEMPQLSLAAQNAMPLLLGLMMVLVFLGFFPNSLLGIAQQIAETLALP